MVKCCSSDRARFATSPLSLADKLAVINGLGRAHFTEHILTTHFTRTFYEAILQRWRNISRGKSLPGGAGGGGLLLGPEQMVNIK